MILVYIERVGGILFLCMAAISTLYFFFGSNGVPKYSSLIAFKGTFHNMTVTEEPAVKITLNNIDTNNKFVFISNKNDSFKIYSALKILDKGNPVTILYKKDDNKDYKTLFQLKIDGKPVDSYLRFEEHMNERHKRFLHFALTCLVIGLYILWGVRGK